VTGPPVYDRADGGVLPMSTGPHGMEFSETALVTDRGAAHLMHLARRRFVR
jgi:hypothetical protein